MLSRQTRHATPSALPALLLATLLGACASHAPDTEALSLMGRPLLAADMLANTPPEKLGELLGNLSAAELASDRAGPGDEQATIWHGRRLAYLARYNDAVAVFTRGLRLHPDSAQLLRHRGHRMITLRRLDEAVRDLSSAARLVRGTEDEIEPDGAPNAAGIPTSTLQGNIHYHLGLAHFLRGDFSAAMAAYRTCLELSRWNDDMLCATTHWAWMTARRLGLEEEAASLLEPISADMNILENNAYHQLLLLYRGERQPEQVWSEADADVQGASAGFGVAHWHLLQGNETAARAIFEQLAAAPAWAAFGVIAAEAELSRPR